MKRQRYKRAKREEARSVAAQLKAQLRVESLPDDDELDRLLSCAVADNRSLLLDLTRVAKALMVGYTVRFVPPRKRSEPMIQLSDGEKLLKPAEVEELFNE